MTENDVPSTPITVIDGRDITVFETLNDAEAAVETYDVDEHEFFDAAGRPLTPITEGYKVRLRRDPSSPPEVERLESALRAYFTGLATRDDRWEAFATRAANAAELRELLDLRLSLGREAENEKRRLRSLWGRLSGRDED